MPAIQQTPKVYEPMKKSSWPFLFGIVGLVTAALCRADGPYHFLKEIPVGGEGGWDALTVDSAAQRLYVSHAAKVVVIDLVKDQVVGEITNTPGVHDIAVAPEVAARVRQRRPGKQGCRRGHKIVADDLQGGNG